MKTDWKKWGMALWLGGLSLTAAAQQTKLSVPMETYRDGCLKMLEAIREKDKFDLYEAKELLNKVQLGDWTEALPAGNAGGTDPLLYFDAQFADSLIRHNFDFVAMDDMSQMRGKDGLDGADLLVLNRAVAPRGVLEYRAGGSGRCELMVVAEKAEALKLTVTDADSGQVYEGTPAGGGRARAVVWDLPEDGMFTVRVENGSDETVSLVVAVL